MSYGRETGRESIRDKVPPIGAKRQIREPAEDLDTRTRWMFGREKQYTGAHLAAKGSMTGWKLAERKDGRTEGRKDGRGSEGDVPGDLDETDSSRDGLVAMAGRDETACVGPLSSRYHVATTVVTTAARVHIRPGTSFQSTAFDAGRRDANQTALFDARVTFPC